jgi:leucyl aminopeptidase
VINPLTLGERCQALFTDTNVKVSILDEKDLAALGAGGLLGVGQGSQTPPRLIILEYPGSGSGVGSPPVVLVGKAITFDTGGYSIKDSPNIQRMKYDKCGGVDVAAILAASAALEMEVPLVGIISAAENMISAQAYRPDDVITTLSGKTVEIVTTDAEGRLVLADALTYAQNHFKPRAIIDLATLTGGVVVALGRVRAGMMANDDPLAQALMDSGEKTHERLWRLPLDDDYFQAIEGDDADLKNSGGREGHAIYGGIFLKQFLNPGIPWAHLDIAGTADSVKDLPYCIKGATGFSVRLILEYLGSLE